jgi:hypothetical protein
MNKELFVNTIEQIKKQEEMDIRNSERLNEIFPNAFNANLIYNNQLLKDQLLKLLKIEMNDGDDWIEYFIYELDYGKKYREGVAVKNDGVNINLSDSGFLYDFLKEHK